MLHKICINAFINELQKIAAITSPSSLLFKASRPGKHYSIQAATRPPLPPLGGLGKLPSPPSVAGSGTNVSAMSRTNSSAPKSPQLSSMTGKVKSLI